MNAADSFTVGYVMGDGVPEYIEVELSDFFDDSEPDESREYDDAEAFDGAVG